MTKPKTNAKINGNDYYRIRKKIDGQSKSFYGRTKAEAEKKYEAWLDVQNGYASTRLCRDYVTTFDGKARDYISNVLNTSQKYANATKDRYSTAYTAHIKGTWLGKMPVAYIRAYDVQKFYNELPVSKQTMATVNKFMAAFDRWLVLNGYAEDFLSAVEIPTKPENKRHDGVLIWEDDEISAILSAVDGHRLKLLVYILLYTGTRISEAIALEHGDIHDGCVHIIRQCYCGEIKPPKYGSRRAVPMHDDLLKAYAEHIEWQAKDMIKNGYETDLLFTTSTGNMYDPVDIRRSLRRLYKSHGIPYKPPHTYRATFCSQLCRCGIPIEVASRLMGHKSIEVTSVHYTHVKRDSMESAIARLRY